MGHAVKVTVLDTKCYPELQQEYCKHKIPGPCNVYRAGDVYLFQLGNGKNHFWNCGLDSLVKTSGDPDQLCGGPKRPFCAEAWDAISRYIDVAQGGGTIIPGWMEKDNTMIACCNDGTRPVIFKIERIDYGSDDELNAIIEEIQNENE